MASPVPTRQELTVIGIRLTLPHAAESIHRIAPAHGNQASTGHPVAAAEAVTATLDSLLADLCTPGEPHALARALQRNPLTAHPQPTNVRPLTPHLTAGPGPAAGDIEHLLHNLKVTDPHLLLRAIALDHATRPRKQPAMATSSSGARRRAAPKKWMMPLCRPVFGKRKYNYYR